MNLKKLIQKKGKEKTLWFMNIQDKITLSKKKCCPPHFWPHKLPFTKLIINEPCHIHNKKWRMAHQKFFCKYLKCPHYKFMVKEYKKYLKSKKIT